MFDAGEYWIGDLSYVLSDDDWDEYFHNYASTPGELHVFADGRKFWYYNTAFGDGTYEDQYGHDYQVDSGTIGIMLLTDIEDYHDAWLAGGNTIIFEDEFYCSYNNGVFQLGDVVIDTGAN
jgi:hypothetical protein